MLTNCQVIESKLRVFKTLSFFILTLCTSIAFAADSAATTSHQNLHIRSLAASCAACHGTQGNASADSATPSISHMDTSAFIAQMMAFRSGERPATVMHRHAKGLTVQEIEGLADYFAKQPRLPAKVLLHQNLSQDYPH